MAKQVPELAPRGSYWAGSTEPDVFSAPFLVVPSLPSVQFLLNFFLAFEAHLPWCLFRFSLVPGFSGQWGWLFVSRRFYAGFPFWFFRLGALLNSYPNKLRTLILLRSLNATIGSVPERAKEAEKNSGHIDRICRIWNPPRLITPPEKC